MTPTQAGNLYNSLKLHFTSEKYDFFKYSGKTKIKFIPQNQIYVFDKLSKKYDNQLIYFYISNFLENPNIWIHELNSENSDEIFRKWLKKNESLTYIFKNEIDDLIQEYEDLNQILIVKKEFPILMKKVLQQKISLETLLIMNSMLNFLPNWDRKINDEIIWNSFKLKCIKYFPFLKFDKVKMKNILKSEVKKMV